MNNLDIVEHERLHKELANIIDKSRTPELFAVVDKQWLKSLLGKGIQ